MKNFLNLIGLHNMGIFPPLMGRLDSKYWEGLLDERKNC